ncbi:acylphosphatase [Alginatibacterium sediminis]|uniref:Acylphosphatase n=1 Tax=Alginatibacterium sediminis TaxID=2164068 RepID=A0A420EHL4_9ALTE|nr:acylphosphatase [Alginatibacterium sediminis]RKF20147.1 acylphosphatase [Alginatibacterium sediminis]
MHSFRAIVKGHVQGVGFRYFTADQALRLGLCGYAKNLNDGSVEVLAVGEQDALGKLALWLKTGSPAARVTALALTYQDYEGSVKGFSCE